MVHLGDHEKLRVLGEVLPLGRKCDCMRLGVDCMKLHALLHALELPMLL